MRVTQYLLAIVAYLATAHVANAEPVDDARRVEFFEAKIRPVLVKHCYSCHGEKPDARKGNLRVDSRQGLLRGGDSGEAIVAGEPGDSLLIAALKYEGPEMPPKGKLPDSVIADFERWIAEGAVDPREEVVTDSPKPIDFAEAAKFWAFQPPRVDELPSVSDEAWIQRDLDHYVLARLEAANLGPRDPATARVLIRRAYFDLLGLPPTPEQMTHWVDRLTTPVEQASPLASSPSGTSEDARATNANAFAELVDHLLESPHYGERWARHWLDVARYAEDQAHTFKARKYPRGYYYRDWVVGAFNKDMPYNQFLMEQIAGDLLPGPNRHERLAALGLFALGPVYYAENVEKAKATADEWDDRVDTLMRGVLGLTASCARCHDHKYDPITMRDYYGLAGVFASSRYEERPIVSDEVVSKRRDADAAANEQQVAIDRFLLGQSRELRSTFAGDVPKYVVAAWKAQNKRKAGKNNKKLLDEVAKQEAVSQTLLTRWLDYLDSSKVAAALRDAKEADRIDAPFLSAWRDLTSKQDAKADLSNDEAAVAEVRELGEMLSGLLASKLDRKDALFKRFGENVAFVRPEDRATVTPGVIPLGNLFDDSKGVTLESALSTDRFKATASADRLGVDRVAFGWGMRLKIAPDVSFDFDKLGSDSNKYGSITNDGWNTQGGISTTGKRVGQGIGRTEQGIGMHANALVTFDLDEIRRAGFLPPNQKFVFRVDRAGLNDDVFGTGNANAHLAVIVSRPHKDKVTTDAIISASVNGQPMELGTDDFTYYFAGEVPPPIKADGQFISYDVAVPAEAKHLTLVTVGAGEPESNTISSDHAVFSGARLELDPLPEAPKELAKNETSADAEGDVADRADAVLLSRFFYDEGLLAVPANEIEPRLPDEPKAELAKLRSKHDELKKAAEAIAIPLAHSLTDGKATDLRVYLQGDPAKQGDLARRAMPVIFNRGEDRPFEPKGSGRLELAKSIASAENPLTARVIVNRGWAGHFGHGLVRTPSNFGQLGERPSHPQLLDYLAVRFVEEGWSLKWLHREIMTSAVYQQSSGFDAAANEVDPENRLLWRMNRRRLEIEPWRDSLLAVTGELDLTFGGPSISLGDQKNKRRTLYGFVSRHRLDELLRLFDFPDPNITAAKRTITTVPLQQLFVLNSQFMMDRANAFVKRLDETEHATDADKIEYAYQLLFGRSPDSEELEVSVAFVADDDPDGGLPRWQQLAMALMSSNEFLYLD